jgi:hypothetical protein
MGGCVVQYFGCFAGLPPSRCAGAPRGPGTSSNARSLLCDGSARPRGSQPAATYGRLPAEARFHRTSRPGAGGATGQRQRYCGRAAPGRLLRPGIERCARHSRRDLPARGRLGGSCRRGRAGGARAASEQRRRPWRHTASKARPLPKNSIDAPPKWLLAEAGQTSGQPEVCSCANRSLQRAVRRPRHLFVDCRQAPRCARRGSSRSRRRATPPRMRVHSRSCRCSRPRCACAS